MHALYAWLEINGGYVGLICWTVGPAMLWLYPTIHDWRQNRLHKNQ